MTTKTLIAPLSYTDTVQVGRKITVSTASNSTALVDRYSGDVLAEHYSISSSTSSIFGEYFNDMQLKITALTGTITVTNDQSNSLVDDITLGSVLASSIVNTPSGNIIATDLQSAINELDGNDLDTLNSAKAYADSLELGLWDDRGNFDASVNTYPTTGGSGTAGAIMQGDIWTISVIATSGVLLGYPLGCTVRALVNAPGQTGSNWSVINVGINYTPEDSANKSTSVITDLASNTKYPSVKAVYDWAVAAFAAIGQVHYVGTTSIAANRASASQALTGITSIDGNAATVTTNANLTGDVTSSGNTTTLTNAPVIAKVLTGYTSGAGTVSASDSILQAIQKLNGNDATRETSANKDATGGYAGLTLFKINFKNAANTFTNFLTNATTAARTYTFPDKDITVAGLVDITGTNSNTNTGDVTLAAIGAVPNANGASLTGQDLTLQPASASFGGVVTTGTQTFAGIKTFTSPTFITPVLGTPSSGTVTNLTGTASININGTVGATTPTTGAFTTITSSGNVAFGTTVNNVYDQVATARALTVQKSDTSTTIGGSTATIAIVNGDTTTNNTAQLNFSAVTGVSTNQYSSAIISAIFGARTNAQYPTGQLAFLTSTTLNAAPSEKMRINSSGDVGIGTTAPSQRLHISGGGALFNNTSIANGASATSGLRIVAPIASTHYNWMIGAQQNIGGTLEFTPSTTINGTSFTTPAMVIRSDGNVGIGATNPTAALHLKAGTTAASTAPIKFNPGSLMTGVENGAVEYDGTHFYATIGAERRQVDNTRNDYTNNFLLMGG